MVVYEGAKPKKSAYRRFKIKSLSAHPDDYASMEEVLTRRIQRYLDGDEKFSPLPDVMLIDGGITPYQLPYLIRKLRVCAQMHVHVPIFGMVKDDRHRTRALVTAQGREIDLHAAPNVFALIGQIQEETHRFAITFHHESHSKSSTRSALDGIPGVGKVRAQALLKTFKSVKAIREADIFALERRRRVRLPSFSRRNGRKGGENVTSSAIAYLTGKAKKKRDFCDLCQQKSKNQVDINEFR